MPGPVFIEGEPVSLRVVEREDVPFLQRWTNHPEIRRYISTFDSPYGQQEYEDGLFEHFQETDAGVSLLACVDGDPVGSAQLLPIREGTGVANLAYWVAPPHTGEGYATAAGRLLVDFGFRERRIERIEADTLAPNAGSRRVLEKLGFTHEGTKRSAAVVDGERVDAEVYGLLREEWEESA
jgi:RimJ/RimL family protein N-acetyltransferase